MATLLEKSFRDARVALLAQDDEVITNFKKIHRSKVTPTLDVLKERGFSSSDGLKPYNDLYIPADAKHLSPYR